VIQSSNEILEQFHDYFHELFIRVDYLLTHEDIQKYLRSNRPDYIFLDLQSKSIDPFVLVEEIRTILPRQVIIVMSSTKDSDMLINCIDHNISSFLLKPFTLTELKDKIIHCLEYLVMSDPTLIYRTKLASLYDTAYDAIKYLIENNNLEVELINHYKGVPLIRQANLMRLDNEVVQVKIKDIQKYILEYSNHTIISSRYLSYDIYAYLKDVDKKTDIATFNKLSFIKSYVHHRKYIRIVPDTFFAFTFVIDDKKYKCKLSNLSIKYALVSVPLLPINFTINSEIKIILAFKLNTLTSKNEFHSHAVQTNATVKKIYDDKDDMKVLFYFDFEENSYEYKLLEDYIHRRSLALLHEFKRNNIPQV